MNRFIKIRPLISIIFFCGSLLLATPLFSETISISTGEYPPGYSEYAPHFGFFLHGVQEAFERVDIKVEYAFRPWKRSYEEAKYAEKHQATCCFASAKDRRQDFFLSEAVYPDTFSFFHLKSYPFQWQSLEDLKDVRIGATRGYTLGDDIMEAEKAGKLSIDWVNKDILSLKKLFKKRIDVVILGDMTGSEIINSMLKPEQKTLIVRHRNPVREMPVYLLFPKKTENRSKRLLTLFKTGLNKLKASGRFDQIYQDAIAGKYQKLSKRWKKQ